MSRDGAKHGVAEIVKLREALQSLYNLLEMYAPAWYKKEHHDQADAALRSAEQWMNED